MRGQARPHPRLAPPVRVWKVKHSRVAHTLHCAAQAEPVTSWQYKAEGAANVVFTYVGTQLSLLSRVLRVPKRGKTSKHKGDAAHGKCAAGNASTAGSTSPAATTTEGKSSSDCDTGSRGAGAPTGAHARGDRIDGGGADATRNTGMPVAELSATLGLPTDADEYADTVMAPLLGRRYCGNVLRCAVPRVFLEAMQGQLAEPVTRAVRPPRRLGTCVDVQCGYVTVMDDYTCPWVGTGEAGDGCAASAAESAGVVSVEIKVKCGALPRATGVSWPAKLSTCRFHMHQHVKTQYVTRYRSLSAGTGPHVLTWNVVCAGKAKCAVCPGTAR